MPFFDLLFRRKEEVSCTVELINTFDQLGAHVRLDEGDPIQPGDEVLIHGPPVMAPYGETLTVRRTATITRASWLERRWTRATGDFEFMELCEFSFSERATL